MNFVMFTLLNGTKQPINLDIISTVNINPKSTNVRMYEAGIDDCFWEVLEPIEFVYEKIGIAGVVVGEGQHESD